MHNPFDTLRLTPVNGGGYPSPMIATRALPGLYYRPST